MLHFEFMLLLQHLLRKAHAAVQDARCSSVGLYCLYVVFVQMQKMRKLESQGQTGMMR